jgi:hypothetical protein
MGAHATEANRKTEAMRIGRTPEWDTQMAELQQRFYAGERSRVQKWCVLALVVLPAAPPLMLTVALQLALPLLCLHRSGHHVNQDVAHTANTRKDRATGESERLLAPRRHHHRARTGRAGAAQPLTTHHPRRVNPARQG